MTYENIKELLVTICQYNTVRIIQTFSRDNSDWIRAKCVPGTSTLELTFLDTGDVQYYESVDQAANIIEKAIYSSTTV